MTPGVDSYVTLAQANAYAASVSPGSPWFTLSDTQREQRLVSACEKLEALPFVGRKTDRGQALAFPRFPGTQVPAAIEWAQIGIALLGLAADSREAEQRADLQRQGVTAFSLGDLSETYGSRSELVSRHEFLADGRIFGLLARFLQGGYTIC